MPRGRVDDEVELALTYDQLGGGISPSASAGASCCRGSAGAPGTASPATTTSTSSSSAPASSSSRSAAGSTAPRSTGSGGIRRAADGWGDHRAGRHALRAGHRAPRPCHRSRRPGPRVRVARRATDRLQRQRRRVPLAPRRRALRARPRGDRRAACIRTSCAGATPPTGARCASRASSTTSPGRAPSDRTRRPRCWPASPSAWHGAAARSSRSARTSTAPAPARSSSPPGAQQDRWTALRSPRRARWSTPTPEFGSSAGAQARRG